jgi:LuxR family maltose regulon positive regulatory protein
VPRSLRSQYSAVHRGRFLSVGPPAGGCWEYRPDQALALLDRLDSAAVAQHRAGSLIEIRALRAMTLAAFGDETGATAALTTVLELGCPQGYVRVFADEGPAMAAVLGRLIAAQHSDRQAAAVPLTCLARLQRAFSAGRAPDGRATVESRSPRLVEQLTGRELEILAMLAAGRSNRNIAS